MRIQMNKLQLLYEYDTDFFSYFQITKELWSDLLKDAKKEFKIYFDNENNDTKKVQRKIEIPQNEWEHTKCIFNCELFAAGGDWEHPVFYFRCQLDQGYALNLTKYGKSHFIFIPGKTQGNYHLVPTDKGEWRAPSDETHKKGIDPEPNEKKCWDSLKEYLKSLVEKEIERIKLKRENNDSI